MKTKAERYIILEVEEMALELNTFVFLIDTH